MTQTDLFEPKVTHRACFYDLHGGRLRKKFNAATPKALIYFSEQYRIPVISKPEEMQGFDTVFFSLHCFRDFYLVAELSKHKRNGQEWVAGGNACVTPTGILWIMDYVWIGDCFDNFKRILEGERDLPAMLSQREPSRVVQYSDETISAQLIEFNDSEVEMSKGCPRRCLFCIHPWRHKYQEQNKEAVLEYIRHHPKRGIGLMSNSSDDVSYYDEVAALLDEQGKTDMVVSNAVQGLTVEVIRKRKREMLLGVEGMSERLRRVVNKPICREVLRERIGWCLEHGKQIRTVYQFNLPGETSEDFEELADDVRHFQKQYSKGSWAIPFIPNQVSAHTPFQWNVPRYSVEQMRRIQAFRESLFGSGKTGISIYSPQPLGPSKWFGQVIAEWIAITPKVSKAVDSMPTNREMPEMIEWLESQDVKLPESFLNRKEDTVFPWDNIKTTGDDPNKWRRFAKMQTILDGDLFKPKACAV